MDQFHKVKETCCIPCADEESDFPIFSNNKSQEEFHIACYVNDKQKDDGCTYMDFQGYVDVNDTNENTPSEDKNQQFTGYRFAHNIMSPVAEQLQDALKRTEHHEEIHLKGSNKSRSRDECRKKLISNIDQLVNSERVSLKVLRDFDDAVAELKNNVFKKLSSKSISNQNDCDFEFACDEKCSRTKEKRRLNGLDY
jgi:hypothetical protein